MKYFNRVSTLSELKLLHRRLAMLNHPDIGGDVSVMMQINSEYELVKRKFLAYKQKFGHVTEGDLVVVNGSISEVIQVSSDCFKAKSSYSFRIAEFSKVDGVCLSNPKFIATEYKSIQRW